MQIVDAARWLAGNPQAVEQGDFAEVDAKPWDSSVQALTRFPDVIKMLSEHLDWTKSLGWAYSVQPTDVGTAIQMLRAKAETLGNLQVHTRAGGDDAGRSGIESHLHRSGQSRESVCAGL